MANRFEKLFCLPNNLYSDESPVIVVAGVLLKDTQSGKLVVQLKFKNISEFQIKALKIKLAAYDAVGERIAGEREYQYLDLQIFSGDEFGANKAIIMPDAATRSFDIQTIWAVEQNGTIHDVSMPLNALPLLRPLNTVINHEELVKQFIFETNQKAAYAPRKVSDIWQCSCGEWNGSDVCTKCRIFKNAVFSAYDPTTLVEKTKNRIRKENTEKQAQAEQERSAVEIEAAIQENNSHSTGNARYSGKIRRKIKKKTIIGLLVLLLVTTVILAILLLSASVNSSEGMTELDKKYDKLANKAAIELLQSEVSDYTWTTVETGDLVYLYTAKNSNEDQFQVHYLAKFDAADEPEDEWVELTISLSGKTNSVTGASACYWSVTTYESSFDENNQFSGFKCSWGAGGDWYNVNLADDEFEAAKQERADFYSVGQNDVAAEESIHVKPDTTIPTEKKKSNRLSEEERILVGSWGAEYLVVNGNITAADELADYGLSLSSLSNAKFNSDYSGSLYFNENNYSLEWSYDTKDDGIILYSLKIGSASTTLSYVTDPSMSTLYNRLIIEIDGDTKIIMTKSS